MDEFLLTRVRKRFDGGRVSSWQRLVGREVRSRVRVWPFMSLVIVWAVILASRLTQLTVVEGAYYRKRADANRVFPVRVAAQRGVFIDRFGKVMVRNVPAYKRQVTGTSLAAGMFESISREEALNYSTEQEGRIFFDISRDYLCGRACALLLGYLAEIDAEELSETGSEYILGDLLGKSGLERSLERELRGIPGSELIEVNASGQVERRIGELVNQPGNDLQLTLDMELQQFIYSLGEEKTGGVVVQKPETGEILALVSWPSYDPNNVAVSLQEEHQPFFSRVMAGAYPPGSVFKVVTAVAGLEEKKITAESVFEDTGEIVIDEYRFGNWFFDEHGRTEGSVDVVKALQRSNDIFFYRVGGLVGPDLLADWARLFGYGEAISLAGVESVAGTVPDPTWKERTKGEKWFLGNTYHMAIGQGDVLVSPLQVNRMMGAVASGGSLCQPVLLAREVGKRSCTQMNFEAETLEVVTEGLKRACEPGGTGVPFFRAPYKVACKTGTAQQGGEKADPHAWFTIFGPLEGERIVVTVLVERGGQGSEVAAPVAREVMDWWVRNRGGS